MVRYANTLVGQVPTEVDYSDYRTVSGVNVAVQVDRDLGGWAVHHRAKRGTSERAD